MNKFCLIRCHKIPQCIISHDYYQFLYVCLYACVCMHGCMFVCVCLFYWYIHQCVEDLFRHKYLPLLISSKSFWIGFVKEAVTHSFDFTVWTTISCYLSPKSQLGFACGTSMPSLYVGALDPIQNLSACTVSSYL